MACLSKKGRFFICLLLLTVVISGCVSLRIDRINKGSDVPSPSADIKEGSATLAQVLALYGAPTDVVDMQGQFALIYKRSFYQGGQLSIGIPLSDMLFSPSLKMEAAGNLLRHDLLALFFTPDGILAEIRYERGAGQPFWGSFWK